MTKQSTRNIQGNRLICHKCIYIKSPAELSDYGNYRLCRNCSRKFTILKEMGKIGSLKDFVMAE
ncbi:MAG: hypothetical protein PHU23_15440 [Dehalococcoidales bacterium]|nr:hypothetical protein [Dehalococcoidales bacterium]